MENNNRQGCRWTKAIQERIDYLKKADAEVCEKRWGNITRALERMVARETSNFLTERRHELEDLLRNMESIEPCATSSEKVNIVMKRIKQQEPDEAGWSYNSDFLREFTEKVNEKDWGEGLSMEQVESVLITAEEYEHEQLKSQTPTGDRYAELENDLWAENITIVALKKRVEKLERDAKVIIELENTLFNAEANNDQLQRFLKLEHDLNHEQAQTISCLEKELEHCRNISKKMFL